MTKRKWYCIEGELGHQGTGRSITVDVYIWTRDAAEALLRYRNLPGFKKHSSTPSTFELTDEEAMELEQRILEDPNISLKYAKKNSYYDPDMLPDKAIRKLFK